MSAAEKVLDLHVMADGEANFYTLSGAPGSWIARVQFNGEICERHQQELAGAEE